MEIGCFTQECLSLYETFQTSVIKCPHSCPNTRMKFIPYLKPCFLIKKKSVIVIPLFLHLLIKKIKLIKLQFFHNIRFHEYLLKLQSMNQISSKKPQHYRFFFKLRTYLFSSKTYFSSLWRCGTLLICGVWSLLSTVSTSVNETSLESTPSGLGVSMVITPPNDQ